MKLLGISGSLRSASLNTLLLKEALSRFDHAEINLADIRLPLYDGDLESAEGIPLAVKKLAIQISQSDAVFIASPEYNQGISGSLKNAFDWVSRVKGNPWEDKPVVLLHAAAGRTGGARANYALRLAIAPFQPHVIGGPEILVAGASKEFDEAGHLISDRYNANLDKIAEKVTAAVIQQKARAA